jgi:hypothetical protein
MFFEQSIAHLFTFVFQMALLICNNIKFTSLTD